MKKFEDYQDEIYTCSRCGLCQSVCPVFDVTQKETTVSRGFFSTLLGVLRGHLSLNKKLRKNIDMCLTCNKCKEFCPSGIDAEKIIISAKIASFDIAPLWKKLITRGLYSSAFLNIAGMVRFYRFMPFLNFTYFGRVLYRFLTPTTLYKKQKSINKSGIKTAIFAGCINNHFNPSSLNAMKMLLEKNGVEYVLPPFDCCTMPAYNIGDLEAFVKMAKKNLDKVPEDVDFVLFDCATCKKAFRLYSEVLEGDYQQKALQVLAKCKHINEFLFEHGFLPEKSKAKVAYHRPCHSDFDKATIGLISSVGADVDILENKCCGSAGLFFLENDSVSKELLVRRFNGIKCAEVDYLATDCPLCRLGLIRGAEHKNIKVETVNLVEIFTKEL